MVGRTWGFTADEWASKRAELRRLLIHVASRRSTLTYGEIARRIFDGRVTARSAALMQLLGEVDSEAEAEFGVMIASLVVRADTGMPGEGFFHFLAEERGTPYDDSAAAWEIEAERAWDAFAPMRSSVVS